METLPKAEVTWSSDNEQIIYFSKVTRKDKNGKVLALPGDLVAIAPGKVKITATYRGISKSYVVTVRQTLESQFPDVNKRKQNNVKVKISRNDIEIKVYANYVGLTDDIIDGSNQTFKELSIMGFEQWSGDYIVFGNKSKVTVKVIEDKNGMEFKLEDVADKSFIGFAKDWSTTYTGTGTLRKRHTGRELMSPEEISATSKHEFGHVLGIDDDYQDRAADGKRPKAFDEDAPTYSIMSYHWNNPPVRGKDIQMLIYAWNYNKWQTWRTYGGYTKSKALDYQ